VAVQIDDAWIREVTVTLPELPESRRRRYVDSMKLTSYEADVIITDPALANLLEDLVSRGCDPKEAASWIMGEFLQACRERECDPQDLPVPPDGLVRLIRLVRQGEISRGIARVVFQQVWKQGADPDVYIAENNLRMVSDPADLARHVDRVIDANPQSVADYRAGKTKAMGFLVGQVMRAMQGKADPALLNQLMAQRLQTGDDAAADAMPQDKPAG